MAAVVGIGELLGEVVEGKGSLNPRPGREGMTRWKGWRWVSSSGSVRGLMRCVREKLVKGKGGIRSSGMALARGDLTWMKWIRTGVVVVAAAAAASPEREGEGDDVGMLMPVRN